jgi:CHAT domain-containing protein
MLAEKDLYLKNIPYELEQRRKTIDFDYDSAQEELSGLSPVKEKEQFEALVSKMRNLRLEQDRIADQIRKSFPQYASLKYPQPLTLEETQKILDPGTVLLSYSLAEEHATLFAITRSSFRALDLDAPEEDLDKKVSAYRNALQQPSTLSPDAIQTGRELYKTLIEPVSDMIATGDRIVIVPEGSLHSLPFVALIRKLTRAGGKPEYLIHWKPVHVVLSATVYAELQKNRKGNAAVEKPMVAFGDPLYPAKEKSGNPNNAAVRDLETRGILLSPLPSSRKEVEEIAKSQGAKAKVFVGSDATEEAAKIQTVGARYIHFACHGIMNERFPLDSGLALTLPDRIDKGTENGLLQAWEILEQLHLDADLVVLSACKTGLGKDLGGEGLVGLTRAFQYAGAQSVVATLWSIADQPTAPFMRHFYESLKSGKSKDEALRLAQLDFLNNATEIEVKPGQDMKFDASAPFFWAGFQLIGDWK